LKWLEVSISLSGELAEPVSDLFSRHSSGGIALEAANPEDDQANPKIVLVRAFLSIDGEMEDKRRDIEEGLWHLSQIQPLPQPQFRFIDEQDWENAWKSHYQPITIGKTLIIQPAWIPLQKTDRLPLIMDPGMAFGTGTHPSTQLCLIAIEEMLQEGQTVIDIGCGSGILSIAAARLGAGKVFALDIDSVAIRNARKNIDHNRVGQIVKVLQGSIELLLDEILTQRMSADLVLGNITSKTLIEMISAGLGETITADGTIILSGILDHQVSNVQSACEQANLQIIETRSMEDWRALVLKRIPPAS
jgi:ribosomal protein L11 methyltransferase